MTESLPLKDILDVIDTAKISNNSGCVNQKILDLYNKNFGGESSIYFQKEDSEHFTDVLKANMDEQYNKDYKSYYHRFDPLDLMGLQKHNLIDIELVENVDYSGCERSEYYSDFLSPQKIHYKLIVSLKSGKELLGKILLTKSKESGNFTEEEITTAKEITPFMIQAVEMNRMKAEMENNNSLLRMIEDNLNSGLMLLDSSKRLIHMNSRAMQLCKRLRTDSFEIKGFNDIHPQVVRDYSEMLDELSVKHNPDLILPRKRIFKNGTSTFSVRSDFIENNDLQKRGDFILINFNETAKLAAQDNISISESYRLSTRETEVVNQVIKGLSNSQIAKELFISEVTVKKHLQNIFNKMEVSNRASLIQKILSGHNS